MDYLAIVSNGTFPTPTPTVLERASFASSYGLISAARILAGIKKITGMFGIGRMGLR